MHFSKRTAAMLAFAALGWFIFPAGYLRAQETTATLTPVQSGHVNDYAGVIDATVKERLENTLANLKDRSGIDFAVVTVKSTEGKKIFDYSLQIAREWKIGSLQSSGESLLIVVSTDDGQYLAQISRGLRGAMPDGLMGEISSRMRAPVDSHNYADALATAVQTFIAQMSEKRGFSLDGIEQARAVAAPTPTPDAQTDTTAPASEPTTAAPAKESAAEPAKQKSLREIFTREGANTDRTKTVVVSRDVPEKAELDALPSAPAERIEKLKVFLDAHPRSTLKPFAIELLIAAHAALGDEKLKAGDAEGGVAEFNEALILTPDQMSEALYSRVVSQIPINLYMRGQRSTSKEAARLIEAKVKDDAKRLLALAGFFLSIEEADEAARLAERAIQLVPEMAAAHQALGASRHIALRLDEAASEYARAVELDPKLHSAKRSLADSRRAAGKGEEALALYREQLANDPTDKTARAGVVLSLLDLGKREEAEAELASALKADAKDLPLLVGASYWYAAHNEPLRAQQLATKAIEIEPRYTWAHIALARALVAQKHAPDAEGVLRFARTYGNFPTLDYELASALAASGLYEEAATELARSFTIKDGQIETRLAGRVPAHGATFLELLAPERRAGIFQFTAADTEANARMLKGLLIVSSVLSMSGDLQGSVDRSLLASGQQDFLAGEDALRAYRQIYVAGHLLQRGVELQTAIDLAEAAGGGVEAALTIPAPTLAVMADELRDARARATSARQGLPVTEVQPNVLANILRGRIEDLIGWSSFNQDKRTEALTHLRRAISVLPENTVWWRKAQWHLGATLDASGNQQEALAAYLKSYNPYSPDPVRRAIIESLYRKVNGSLDGLDSKIGPAAPAPRATPPPTTSTPPSQTAPAATEQNSHPSDEKPKSDTAEEKKP
ncbi:MAG: hypothetical protein QOJ64_1342 [Acidobacteriota bacterium]|jgi:uncharacterized membrane protein YgcG/tetratricopeptide (TPR) repeat protein|nr:hypothetical protein [Acidobacteriota bacterium]